MTQQIVFLNHATYIAEPVIGILIA